jgi:hypothetical protein
MLEEWQPLFKPGETRLDPLPKQLLSLPKDIQPLPKEQILQEPLNVRLPIKNIDSRD